MPLSVAAGTDSGRDNNEETDETGGQKQLANDMHSLSLNLVENNCNSAAKDPGEEGPLLANLASVLEARPKQRCMGRCDIELGEVTKHNVMQLKRLNQSVFPVSYNEKFYKDVVVAGELARLAYFNDIVVGAVCCRVDTRERGGKSLYIMTLGTLAPYRRYGVGTTLLEHVFTICEKDQQIKSIYLHVQINNESALDFYRKFGFDVTGTAEKYYKRIDPDDAFILEKLVNQ